MNIKLNNKLPKTLLDVAKKRGAIATMLLPYINERVNFDKSISIEFKRLRNFNAVIYPRTNVMAVNVTKRVKLCRYAETLTHELIHSEQMNTGRLQIADRGHIIWEGKKYKLLTKYNDKNFDEYANQPWELDATSRQYDIAIQSLIEMFNSERDAALELLGCNTSDWLDNVDKIIV